MRQFSLLVLVNAFVDGMVGLERNILPRLAEQEFHLAARSAVLSFIVVFGLAKAVANYYAGAGRVGPGLALHRPTGRPAVQKRPALLGDAVAKGRAQAKKDCLLNLKGELELRVV